MDIPGKQRPGSRVGNPGRLERFALLDGETSRSSGSRVHLDIREKPKGVLTVAEESRRRLLGFTP